MIPWRVPSRVTGITQRGNAMEVTFPPATDRGPNNALQPTVADVVVSARG